MKLPLQQHHHQSVVQQPLFTACSSFFLLFLHGFIEQLGAAVSCSHTSHLLVRKGSRLAMESMENDQLKRWILDALGIFQRCNLSDQTAVQG